jgi:catechol-2,3-dioxygenase
MSDSGISIAHVTIQVRRPDRWKKFIANLADSMRIEWDDDTHQARHALRITQGRSDDLEQLGLAYPTGASLEAAVARLTQADIPWERVDSQTVRCVDPAGNQLELVVFDGPAPTDARWLVGHVALTHRDQPALEHFYSAILGLRLNEQLRSTSGPIDLHGSFLGSAHRHHSIAILDLPSTRRLHHICFGAKEISTVKATYERAVAAKVPMSMHLGRHSLPDGTTSFYAASPSGFDIEIGAGGNILDGRAIDAPLQGDLTSAWGHEVTTRARMRVVRALALQRLGLA